MAIWRLVLLTLFSLSLPLAAQAARLPSKSHHAAHHGSHASRLHRVLHHTA